jgi:hypothetical protein
MPGIKEFAEDLKQYFNKLIAIKQQRFYVKTPMRNCQVLKKIIYSDG